MKIGGYVVQVETSKLPQKVASGFGKCFDNWVGASYTPIAYLGSKLVNGINHAILAEQNLIIGKDVRSIVLVILNEKPGDVDGSTFSVVEIQTYLSSGTGKLGGININPTTDIPADAKAVFDKHYGGFFGANNTPIALLATQAVNGIAYFFAVESKMVVSPTAEQTLYTSGNQRTIQLVKMYGNYNEIEVTDILSGSAAGQLLGEANPDLVNWP